jgi:endonuclease/exonuclease/phosphatase (EEP) superfamily protein YafD
MVLSFLGEHHWLFDLFNHFQVHYFILSILLIILGFIVGIKLKVYYIALLLCFGIQIFIVGEHYFADVSVATDEKTFKVLSLNLKSSNHEYDKLVPYVLQESPDIIFLFEFTNAWAKEVLNLKNEYPFAKAIVREDNFGIAILSKTPITSEEVLFDTESGEPLLKAQLELSGVKVNIQAVHPFPPIGKAGSNYRNKYFKNLIANFRERKVPTLICGDFNASSWSSSVKKIEAKTNLRIPKGFGVLTSWPVGLGYFGIPIDHCLVSSEIKVIDYRKGKSLGSDHSSILMTFYISEEVSELSSF